MRKLIAIVCLTAACSATKSTTEPASTSTNAAPQTAAQAPPQTATQTAARQPEPIAAKSGEELYGQICVTCHGKTGDGKGLEQQLFSFATPVEQWKNGPTIDGIVATMQEGLHNSSMAAFPNYGAAEREAIAAYVLELRSSLIE